MAADRWNFLVNKVLEGNFMAVDVLGATIMIVDDSISVVRFMEMLLRQQGYKRIEHVLDSRQAVEMYQTLQPDLVILDLNMPYLDGFEVMEQLKTVRGETYLPVLVLTAQDDREDRIRALAAGARDFLTKPVDQLEAVTRIRNLLEASLLHNSMKKEHQELLRHLEQAGALQKRMLPVLKNSPYADIHTCYYPASAVSGGFYDLLWVSDCQAVGILADVMAHDMEAALAVSAIKLLFQNVASLTTSPSAVISYLRDEWSTMFSGQYLAALCYYLDFRQGILVVASAGLNAFVVTEDGKAAAHCVPGVFIGHQSDKLTEENTVQLTRGMQLHFFTDRLSAVMNNEEALLQFDANDTVVNNITRFYRYMQAHEQTDDFIAVSYTVKQVDLNG